LANDETRLVRSRALADQLQTALSQRLMAAIVDGGPVAAIDGCREEAPEIAARLSVKADAHVGRTALRVRNPATRRTRMRVAGSSRSRCACAAEKRLRSKRSKQRPTAAPAN
jgi:hypothetical protein